ncbi:M20 family metallo-hydrolase [Halalkalibacter alkaliphilus]|uniref:M20 family metallo-hydrolase n=1 Tax=Halalkalibacter alkaliphilus TaxID=2917993 RepID=A0A9X2A5N6_9BACI|nr:M20 family metallo-hydrolase [Halalkalibacter alkaliphilus]MCL7745666.1 M20 family metallo-hydrolase [Halalkalibacter alkaliphilus]
MTSIKINKPIQINHDRLQKRLIELAQIGKIQETGVCRLTLSKEDKQAVLLVEKWMGEAGLSTRIDAVGNLIGQWTGSDDSLPILVVGSHIDSQPYGGRFDGTIGVIGAIEAIQTMNEQGYNPERTIEVIAFSDEEGCRFDKGLFGARGIIGQLEEGELERKDINGITRREALVEFGCNPNEVENAVYPKGRIGSFLEMHIEQGPILDKTEKPVGLVTGISGPLWLTVELKGFAGHAGSVPIPYRQDALVAAAEITTKLRELASEEPEAPTVATVGKLEVFPNSRNIIPEHVRFTIDLRDIDIKRRDRIENKLYEAIDEICDRHKVTKTITVDTKSDPRYCSDEILEEMRTAARTLFDESLPEMMSGPFHDALAMSSICDFGMIFVRCKDGISHNPKESANYTDISLGTELLYRTIILRSNAKEE